MYTSELEILEGFDSKVAQKLVLQAQSRMRILNFFTWQRLQFSTPIGDAWHILWWNFFDIEAEPDLNLDYMLGVLVVNHNQHRNLLFSWQNDQKTKN